MPRAVVWALLVFSGCFLSGCGIGKLFSPSDYEVTVESPTRGDVTSVYVVVGNEPDLATKSQEEIADLVNPKKLAKYHVYTQFNPRADGQGLERVGTPKEHPQIQIEESTDGPNSILSVEIDEDFLVIWTQAAVVVPVQYSDGHWNAHLIPAAVMQQRGAGIVVVGPTGIVFKAD